jgi:hypothetical protein
MSLNIVLMLGLLALPACLGVQHFFPEPTEYGGFAFGLSIFLANMGLVAILVKRFLSGISDDASAGKPSIGGFVFIGMIKVGFLGASLYVGLSVLGYSPWFLVSGACWGLVEASVIFYWQMMKPAQPE